MMKSPKKQQQTESVDSRSPAIDPTDVHTDTDETHSGNVHHRVPKHMRQPKYMLTPSGQTRLNSEEYDSMSFVKKPHSILTMVIAGLVVVYFAFTKDQSSDTSIKTGLLGACGAFLLFSMLQMRDGVFVRPHPAFWRVVMGMGVIYLCSLVFLLFQSADDARKLMKHIDPKLGVPLPERSYGDNCDLYTPNDPKSSFRNLMDTINDEFIWAHFFGWWGKTVLMRDTVLCWTLSISFEILELTFAHWLPNFHECWWDHIILDILVCNALGIVCGVLTIKYLKMKEYKWAGNEEKKIKKKRNILARALKQFTPVHYEDYNWQIASDWKRFLHYIFVVVLVSLIELNAFFLKTLLWIPPPHIINVQRLVLLLFIGTPALREYYQFVSDKQTKKLGPMAWIVIAIIAVELLICVKYGGAMFWEIPFPPMVKYPWYLFLSVSVIGSVYYYGFYNRAAKKKLH
ncbi:hypothetical protein SAMD00019534_038650 [Acytostelium subglobosum LB1]|uniref:hypothetical protein n=1 Tax=Acytostelium subglobosum LB1 TaxID=1410327 RepID=UPI000644A369|nr:hypothetical protein SAMD00019534_038650 [Acytostelium subglobosum LB1]GAM20690.1 hypothetical protein SAMD00019534_038650 [Acytostelium subglobosum LB1]|eukprot:XP_012760211.1 hypothetical protein SAMD00019534_038650 [Acytostelium subglobosum LB1]